MKHAESQKTLVHESPDLDFAQLRICTDAFGIELLTIDEPATLGGKPQLEGLIRQMN
jgi:hypothetical protein